MGKDRKKAKDDEKPAKEEPQLNQDLPDLKHIAGLGTCYMTSLAQGADGNPGGRGTAALFPAKLRGGRTLPILIDLTRLTGGDFCRASTGR